VNYPAGSNTGDGVSDGLGKDVSPDDRSHVTGSIGQLGAKALGDTPLA
jgi:hypothetical protein